MENFLKAGLIIAVLAVVILSPLAVVWALNTLFGLTIAYTWQTWLAVLLLAGVVKTNVTIKKD